MSKLQKTFNGFTLIELIIGMTLIVFLTLIGVISLTSLNAKKALQSESEIVKQDIYVMQSRAVTGLKSQRFVILTNSSYRLEEDLLSNGNWSVYQAARSFQTGIYFYGYVGSENKLQYQPSGLPNFNGASSAPFFSLIYNTTAEKKDFNIDSSGVVNIVSN